MKRGTLKQFSWDQIGSVILNNGNYLIPEKVMGSFNTFLEDQNKKIYVSEIIEDDDSFKKYILTMTWGNSGHDQFTFLIEDRYDKKKDRKSQSIGDLYKQQIM